MYKWDGNALYQDDKLVGTLVNTKGHGWEWCDGRESIYFASASLAQAQERVLHLLSQEKPDILPVVQKIQELVTKVGVEKLQSILDLFK